MYFKVSYKAFLLSLSGTERLPQKFMRNFFKTFPSKEAETEACGTVLSPHFIHSSANE